MRITALVVIVGCALGMPGAVLAAPPQEDAGIGFIMTSAHFSDPCTANLGDIPRIYDNASSANVDVSVKFTTTGNSDVHITGTGFNIPPPSVEKRPRVFRVTLAPNTSLGIQALGSNCGWSAIVRPH